MVDPIISVIISFVLSFVTALGFNVNGGITEPKMPAADATKAEIVQYYDALVDTTRSKKAVILSEVYT